MCTVLTQLGLTTGRHTEQVALPPPCSNLSWTTRQVEDISSNQTLSLSQIGLKNQEGAREDPLSVEKAVSLIQDVFSAAAERDIYTGDGLEICVVTAAAVDVKRVPLRRD